MEECTQKCAEGLEGLALAGKVFFCLRGCIGERLFGKVKDGVGAWWMVVSGACRRWRWGCACRRDDDVGSVVRGRGVVKVDVDGVDDAGCGGWCEWARGAVDGGVRG